MSNPTRTSLLKGSISYNDDPTEPRILDWITRGGRRDDVNATLDLLDKLLTDLEGANELPKWITSRRDDLTSDSIRARTELQRAMNAAKGIDAITRDKLLRRLGTRAVNALAGAQALINEAFVYQVSTGSGWSATHKSDLGSVSSTTGATSGTGGTGGGTGSSTASSSDAKSETAAGTGVKGDKGRKSDGCTVTTVDTGATTVTTDSCGYPVPKTSEPVDGGGDDTGGNASESRRTFTGYQPRNHESAVGAVTVGVGQHHLPGSPVSYITATSHVGSIGGTTEGFGGTNPNVRIYRPDPEASGGSGGPRNPYLRPSDDAGSPRGPSARVARQIAVSSTGTRTKLR